jgi:hypothetical protein
MKQWIVTLHENGTVSLDMSNTRDWDMRESAVLDTAPILERKDPSAVLAEIVNQMVSGR